MALPIKIKSSLVLGLCLLSVSGFAAPLKERAPTGGGAPLKVLSSQASQIIVPHTGTYKNRLLIAVEGSSLKIIDTETWALYADQPTAFGQSIGGVAVMPDGSTLYVTLANGNLGKVEIASIADENTKVADAASSSSTSSSSTSTSSSTSSSGSTSTSSSSSSSSGSTSTSSSTSSSSGSSTGTTPTDPREIDLAAQTLNGTLTHIVANPSSNASSIYFINPDDKLLIEYDVSAGKLNKVTLTDAPTDLAFADSSVGGRVVVGTSDGKLLVFTPGGTSVTPFAIPVVTGTDKLSPNIKALSVTPDGNYVYAIDSTNNVIWVFSVVSSSFVNQVSGTEISPIRFGSDENTAISHMALLSVTSPTGVYGYVSGDKGLSIINATDPETATSSRPIVDQDTATASVLDPLTLSGVPGPVAFGTDGYVYTSNGNGEISVITDNPFVNLSSQAVSLTATASTSTFTITLQSDEAGTFRMVANSDVTGTSGLELEAATAVPAADTDVNTSTVDINSFSRSDFIEGANRIFIFVTDADGNVGRGALDITVDRPPLTPTVTSVGFGSKKVYGTVTELSDGDIATYQMFVLQAENQASPSCPGTLDFTSSAVLEGDLSAGDCSGGSCTATVSGLVNGVQYCVAMKAVDKAGQISGLGFGSESISPEQTSGPAGLLGEKGCSLDRSEEAGSNVPFLLTLFWFGTLMIILKNKSSSLWLLVVISPCFFSSESVKAQEAPSAEPQMIQLEMPATTQVVRPEHKWFSVELKGDIWFPSNSTVKSFVGTCCNMGTEVEFGLLYKSRYNFTIAAGFEDEKGHAVGVASGQASSDIFALMMIPIRNNFIYRFDYKRNQAVVPYVGVGTDYVYFHENTMGTVIQGVKFGGHGLAGVAILLNNVDDIGDSLTNAGIDDVYLTIEGRYSYIRSFKSTGLDLSGAQAYIGVMLAF